MTRVNPYLSPDGHEAGGACLQKIRARRQIAKDRFAIRSGGHPTDVVAFCRQYADMHDSTEWRVILKAHTNLEQRSLD
jgi:hypothetical protein